MSWASETRRLTKLRWQVYRLEKQGFIELPDVDDLRTTKDKIAALEKAKKEAAIEIRSRISDLQAKKGEDADLRVKAALANLDGQDLKEIQNILQQIKDTKSDPKSVLNLDSLYSALWSMVDSIKYVENYGEADNSDYGPF